ncbi:MAG: hypothetical protein COB35_08105 [Gammaproteobacteria bacterium]|nr:MAG: hypothetical protein COB35_08105 [Gammaproteobacteria bacterium]
MFNQCTNEPIQCYLITQTDDFSSLEKLVKKALNEQVKVQIEDKIKELTERIEKPIKMRKQIQLLLAKLLALKDIADYAVVVDKRDQINQQWLVHQQNFEFFIPSEQQQFIDKHQSINNQLDKIFIAKAEQYQQQKIADKIKLQQQQALQQFDAIIDNVSKQLVTAVFEENNVDEECFLQQLEKLTVDVENSLLSNKDKKSLQLKIQQQQQRLSQLPEIAQSVSKATQLIAKVAQLSLPESLEHLNERYQIYLDWRKSWQQVVKQSAGLLPESIVSAYQEIDQRWQQGCSILLKQQQTNFQQTRKKCADLKRLLQQGKFNACFSLHKKMLHQYALLSVLQQQKLQRDHDNINEKMAEVSDWEHYIATPKKQELLTAIKALVETPCDNPNEQANKVKEYRKQWNMLGHADDELEQKLNQQFNDHCEQAFAPCRVFYAEQEKVRELNLHNRNEIVLAAKSLTEQFSQQQVNSEVDWKYFDNKLIKLKQQWQNAGDVERSIYKTLLAAFNEATELLKSAIYNQYQQNAELKKQLIVSVEQILKDLLTNTDNINQAVTAVKNLQNKWREIGYAGVKQENKLWQQFRQINDDIFAKREENKQQEQVSINKQQQEFEQALSALHQELNQALEQNLQNNSDRVDLKPLLNNAELLLSQVFDYKPVFKTVVGDIKQFIDKINKTIEQQKKQQKKLQWQNIFLLLKYIAEQQSSSLELEQQKSFQFLSPVWQKRISDVFKISSIANREVETLKLEILAGIESPPQLMQQRMSVQVSLMQEQMTSSTKPDLEQEFLQWLQSGKLTSSDLVFIERVEQIFVNNEQ